MTLCLKKYSSFDEEPQALPAPVQRSRIAPGGSQDSGATSDEETYKVQEKENMHADLADLPLDSPPSQKQNHVLRENRRTSRHMEVSTEITHMEEKTTISHSDSGQLIVLRQPLFPDASQEAFDKAEASGRASDVSAKTRRAFFAKTNQKDEEMSTMKDNLGKSHHWLM